jgi:hypothetical protein
MTGKDIGDAVSAIAGLAIVIGASLAYSGRLYVTGTQYYEACWEKVAKAVADSPYKEILWEQCEPMTKRGIFAMGMMIVPRISESKVDDDARRLSTACPSELSDIPAGGAHVLAVKLITAMGGTTWRDNFGPGEWTAGRAFKAQWPRCAAERQKQGYPKIIERAPGKFGFEAPCAPCKKYRSE